MSQIKSVILFCLLCFSFTVFAVLPEDEKVPGGVAVIKLPKKYNQQTTPPSVYFDDVKVAVLKDGKNTDWYAIVGIPLTMQLGIASIEARQAKIRESIHFEIVDKAYTEEKLFFKENKLVTPNPELAAKIKEETKHLEAVFSSWSDKALENFQLKIPVKGRISGEYGSKRILNGELRSQHRGLDFAAPIGTAIMAAQSGKVIDVGNYVMTGNTVVLDHGQGFKTIYCHLHTVSVKLGEVLEANQKLGTVGKTGRATGPHLHFGVSLNNVRVSPKLFFVN
ncbi:peptidoglycan DD-metalloendopeptidase family protein [Candidatus Berkiella cookevillensis]|uniref:Murein DD-endopeptidase MepM n=1 Tax=Candidatus Berkiella cookevillensis TaxID=437022 RepID=A0A0Q9YBY5_9GAMM|nr:peptidoglycan DD-metalloendopeptidase family protein [Candidatus Berkiella cookevillensis]MCS5709210.1 peptidoglycan DD-metalloendopeptidase family protein [Candidatus Berkiella cookevillensis]